MEDKRKLIRKYAVKNALEYGGAPNKGSILGKVLSKNPDLKKDMAALSKEIDSVIKEVEKMSPEELKSEYSKHEKEFDTEEKSKAEESAKHRMEIEGATVGNFVTRFPPEPGGYLHVGHARPIFIEDELRKIYRGKLFLYFDDTNPDNAKDEFVGAIKTDLAWLGIKFDREYYASDNIPTLYRYAETAIKEGKAYVCTCEGDLVRENRLSGKSCAHKKQDREKNLALWHQMLDGTFKDGEAILRLNSDMKAVNTTMRDPTLFRIKQGKHYRQGDKYTVWPTYDFCTPILDSLNGITDALRDKNYDLRDELYFAVLDLLKLRKPRITSFSRLEIANNITSKRKVRALVEEGKVSGWDDPRLITLRALKRRGITPEAIRELALGAGIGRAESVVPIGRLLDINKRIIDQNAKRLFYAENPVPLKITNRDKKRVELPLHPDGRMGFRSYEVGSDFFIARNDAEKMAKGDRVRLKELATVMITKKLKSGVECEVVEGEYDKTVQWVSKTDCAECTVILPEDPLIGDQFNEKSLGTSRGYVESYAKKLRKGEVVQFERFGFVVLDDPERMQFIKNSS